MSTLKYPAPVWFMFFLHSRLTWGQISTLPACTGLTLTASPTTYSFNTATSSNLNIVVSRTGSPACSYFLTFSRGSSPNFNRTLTTAGSTLPYQLYRSASDIGLLMDFPDVTSNQNVIEATFGAGVRTQSLPYYAILLNTNPYSPFALYSDTVVVSAYAGIFGGTTTLAATTSMSFTYNVPRNIDIAIVNSGGAFDLNSTILNLNFGNLSAGASQSFDIVLQYNAGFALYASSSNNGQLKHSAANALTPYTLNVNASAVNLAGSAGTPVLVATASGTSATGGTRLSTTVTIGTLQASLAGSYNDTLVLSVVSID